MKHLRALALAALAAAMMVLATGSVASATEIDGPEGMLKPGTVSKAESEGKIVLDTAFGNVECLSEVAGSSINTGGSTETVQGTIESMSFSSCNPGNTVNLLKAGSTEVHTAGETSNNDGKLTTSGTEFEVIHLGVQCIWATKNTQIGIVTGSASTKGNATLDVAATIPRTGGQGGAFCGSSAPLTGSFKITSPSTVNIT